MEPIWVDIPKEQVDLTNEVQLDRKIFVQSGAFGMVYQCPCRTGVVVAVKVVTPPRGIDGRKIERFKQTLRRELGIWRRLPEHPNITPLLGKIRGAGSAFDHDCIVSMWMPRGSLEVRIQARGRWLATSHRVQLIKDVANGLNHLHSRNIIHGDLHPGNILINARGNALLTDFGLSRFLFPAVDGLSYLRTNSLRPGATVFAAPELVHPKLYPKWNEDCNPKTALKSDIYSFGNIILFIFCGKMPWPDEETAKKRLKKYKTPHHWEFTAVPDNIWKFVKRCWSPKKPAARPSAQEALSFILDILGKAPSSPLQYPSRYCIPRLTLFLPNIFQRTKSCPPMAVKHSNHAPGPTRILIIGNTGVCKSLFVGKVFGDEFPYPSETVGIDQEFTSLKNNRFVVHYGPGFEVDSEGNMDIIQQFVTRRRTMPQMKDQVHMVWLYLEIPCFGKPLFGKGAERFLQRRTEILGEAVLVVVLTDVDLLDIQLEPVLAGNETLGHSWYPSERLVEPLHSVAGNDVTCAIVSTDDGYEDSISDLLHVTDRKVAEIFNM